ncbi:hypothetical protein Rcas_1049 [Roseiflexus castenholzii DSM 13941]|uniref:Aldo/keto reductase n=2 Tax=Roseiflexus castenholzii TaxID=120962 RepID=A7NI51_ROSCS|nr:hypothetical protein Rcas_1049 [Roseiflexus castenholzii DSM 13941]
MPGRVDMDYVKLGNTGLDVSRICLGCMSFGKAVEAMSIELSAEEIAYMEEPYLPHPIVGHS